MVLEKRLDYGSRGYCSPPLLHVTKSPKGKRSRRRKTDNKMCAFNLLASLAEQLLTDQEKPNNPCRNGSVDFNTTARNSATFGRLRGFPVFKVALDHDSFIEGASSSSTLWQWQPTLPSEHSLTPKEADSGQESLIVNSNFFQKETVLNCVKTDGTDLGTRFEIGANKRPSPCSNGSAEISEAALDGNRVCKDELASPAHDISCLAHPMEADCRTPFVSSASSSELPLCTDKDVARCVSSANFQKGKQPAKQRDDDENSLVCTYPHVLSDKAFRPHYVNIRRIGNLLTLKKEVLSKRKYEGEVSETGCKVFAPRKRKCFAHQKTQKTMIKRRKTITSTLAGERAPYELADNHVKLSITSFKIPELCIEAPEDLTVGLLKINVVKAVMALLGSGIGVGVLIQGKKISNDNITLQQAGILYGDNSGNLDFVLEPALAMPRPNFTVPRELNFLSGGDAISAMPLESIPPKDYSCEVGASDACYAAQLTALVDSAGSDSDAFVSADALPKENSCASSKDLDRVASIADQDPLAVVPLHKPKRCEIGERRIRRPFSVAEVEALVQAVEKLGTGRWRDVKLQGFETAKHRTYVDLKDKWKTLVHTATISPQQRRGEPVPQELLDRVLAANAYWTRHHQDTKSHQTKEAWLLT